MTDPADLYIELLKKSLMHSLYRGQDALGHPPANPLARLLFSALRKRHYVPVRLIEARDEQREAGRDWPLFAQTMIGRARLDNLQQCIETVLRDDVPGDLIETGAWRGGATIFMRGVLKVRGADDRVVWVADSFQGLPPPQDDVYPADAGAKFHTAEDLAVSIEEVQDNFRRYDLLDDQVRFLKGWFRDTLPTVRDRDFALIRLDGDMYESTMDGLTNLYPRLSPGGFLIIDDFSIESCKQAVADYRRENGITEEIEEIDWTGVFWRKRVGAPAAPEPEGAGA